MNRLLIFIPLLLFCKPTMTLAQKAPKQDSHITVDGIERSFFVYLPSGTDPVKGGKMPLLCVLHGRLGTPSGTLKLADFRPMADRDNVILVYPAGIDKSWNDGRPSTPAYKKNIDDVAFIDQLITYMIRNYTADSTSVYVTVMSYGGFMTSRLGCALSRRIAAIAVVAASVDQGTDCHPARPVPVMYIQGTKDPLVPFDGGELKKGAAGVIDSHQQALDRWIAIDQCDPVPRTTHMEDSASDGTSLTRVEYTNATTGVKVVGYTVVNGGHTWPGGWPYLPKMIIGITSRNLNACEAIWDFFKQYRLP